MDISGLFWAPDSVQGFRLGKVIDLGADTISVEPLDDKGMVCICIILIAMTVGFHSICL